MSMNTRIQKIEKKTGLHQPKIKHNEATKELFKKLSIPTDKDYTSEEFLKVLTNQEEGGKIWQR